LRGPLTAAISAVTNRINYIADSLTPDDPRPFQEWVRKVLSPVADKLGWNGSPQDSEERRAIRSAVLYSLGYAGRDPETIREARRRIDMYLTNTGALDPNLIATMVPLAAIDGDAALYDRYLARARESNRPGEQSRFRDGLAHFSDPVLQQRTLDLVGSSELRTQDSPQLLASLLSNPDSRRAAWDYVKPHWASLEQKYGVFQGLPAIVRATGSFCDESSREDVQQFLDGRRLPGIQRAVRTALESIDSCIRLKTEQSQNLSEFLSRIPSTGN
jgi:aminopeptidase N